MYRGKIIKAVSGKPGDKKKTLPRREGELDVA
jgi:hypothetical protein